MLAFVLFSIIAVAVSTPVYLSGNGSPHNALNASESDIKIYYYSRKLSSGVIVSHSNYDGSFEKTDFSSSRRTIVVIHGWRNSASSPICELVSKAYLKADDVNLFVVDWSTVASANYIIAVFTLPQIGSMLGKIIGNWVSNHGLNLDDTVIVGHSLGAHIAGLAGNALDGKIGTIVGLDPAGPGFIQFMSGRRLNPSDAKFVQAVHTCAGNLGVGYTVGHADYFANNGRDQPGCDSDSSGACSHGRSFEFLSESVTGGKFKSVKCDSYSHFKSGACATHSISNMGGYNIDKSASGTYYFETNASPPYAKS